MQYFKKLFYLIVLIGYSCCYAGSYEDFFAALERDDAHSTQSILNRGFDPNSVDPQGQYALVRAMRQSSWKVAQVLIAHPITLVDVHTDNDESPLMTMGSVMSAITLFTAVSVMFSATSPLARWL